MKYQGNNHKYVKIITVRNIKKYSKRGIKMYYVYMLRCIDDSIYTGITTDVERRMKEHFEKDKKCAKYTYRHTALKLEAVWKTKNRMFASKLEYQIKKLSKSQKEELIQMNLLNQIHTIEIEQYQRIK